MFLHVFEEMTGGLSEATTSSCPADRTEGRESLTVSMAAESGQSGLGRKAAGGASRAAKRHSQVTSSSRLTRGPAAFKRL